MARLTPYPDDQCFIPTAVAIAPEPTVAAAPARPAESTGRRRWWRRGRARPRSGAPAAEILEASGGHTAAEVARLRAWSRASAQLR